MHPKYIAYALRTFSDDILKRCAKDGTTVASIATDALERFPLPFAPTGEQLRIVNKLDSLLARVDACRNRLERIPQLLKRFREAVLDAAVSGRLTEQLPERGHKGAFASAIEHCSISKLLSQSRPGMRTGPFGSLLKKSDHRSSGVDVVGIENIADGRFVPGSKIKIDAKKARTLESYDLQYGDVIISRSGTVGEICAIPQNAGELRFSTNIIRVSLDPSVILPSYFVLLFKGSRDVLAQVRELCKGSTRAFLNQRILRSITFPVPLLAQQKEIVRCVTDLFAISDTLSRRYGAAVDELQRLTPAILAKAFRGELVPQDLGEEPASLTLDRIKTGQEAGELSELRRLSGSVRGRGRKKKAVVAGRDVSVRKRA